MRGFRVEKISGDDNSLADVVFVHGLGGSASGTWTGKLAVTREDSDTRRAEAEVCWPKKLTSDKARVWFAGYPAPLFEASHRGKIRQAFEEEGQDALRELGRQGLGRKPLIFVAHSLGGLLVKAIVVASHGEKRGNTAQPNRSIADATAAVLFLATPHAGSDRVRMRHAVPLLIKLALAAVVPIVGYLLRPLLDGWDATPILTIGSSDITIHQLLFGWLPTVSAAFLLYLARPSRHLALLDPGSEELRTLRDDFREFVLHRSAEQPVKVSAYYEKFPTRYRGLPLGILVSWSSADPGLSDVAPQAVEADHVEICKPAAVTQLKLLQQLEETIDAAVAGTKRLALEGPLRIAQAATDDDSADWSLLNLLIEARDFDSIPPNADGRQLRRETELRLREWLRSNYPDGKFQPAMWHLRRARDSRFSIDRFIWQVVSEHELRETMQSLRRHAREEKEKWPQDENAWPGVIPFYRPLRTLERARTGEWGEDELRGVPIELSELNMLTAEAYSALEAAHNNPTGKPPDGDGATRWLLLRMSCVGRAMSVVLRFIGYPQRSSGPERPETRRKRLEMHQQFEAAVSVFEEALRRNS